MPGSNLGLKYHEPARHRLRYLTWKVHSVSRYIRGAKRWSAQKMCLSRKKTIFHIGLLLPVVPVLCNAYVYH